MAKSHAWSQPSIASFQSLVTKTNVERPTEIATKGGFDKGPEEHFKGEKKEHLKRSMNSRLQAATDGKDFHLSN